MEIQVNGDTRTVEAGASIADLIAALDLKPELVAVQHNEAIIDRDRVGQVTLADGDVVELIRIVGGG